MKFWSKSGVVWFEGEVVRADEPTRTGRVYPLAVLKKAFQKAMESELLCTFESSSSDPSRVRLADAVGIVDGLTIPDDGKVMLRGRVLDTRMGRVLIEYLRGMAGRPIVEQAELPMTMSISGMGSVSNEVVQDDLVICSIELVNEEQ